MVKKKPTRKQAGKGRLSKSAADQDDSFFQELCARANAEIYGPGVAPPDYSLLVSKSEVRDARLGKDDPRGLRSRLVPGWPLINGKTYIAPIDDSPNAMGAWIDFVIGHLNVTDSGPKPDRLFAKEARNDAHRLVAHLVNKGRAGAPDERRGKWTSRDLVAYLRNVKLWIKAKKSRTRRVKPDMGTTERDRELADEFETNGWDNIAKFGRRHNMERSAMSKALKRGRKARESTDKQ
jgi:hypothetical protein